MKRIGRAGPTCRRAFARLCKITVIGTESFWKTRLGALKEEARRHCKCEHAQSCPEMDSRPVRDCRRRRSNGRRLNPGPPCESRLGFTGPAQTGKRPKFARHHSCAKLVRTSDTRLRLRLLSGGRLTRASSCPVSLRVHENVGRLVATRRFPRITRTNRQTERACSGSSG